MSALVVGSGDVGVDDAVCADKNRCNARRLVSQRFPDRMHSSFAPLTPMVLQRQNVHGAGRLGKIRDASAKVSSSSVSKSIDMNCGPLPKNKMLHDAII